MPGDGLRMLGSLAKFAVFSALPTLVPITVTASPDNTSTPLQSIIVQGQKLNVETKIDRKIYAVPEDTTRVTEWQIQARSGRQGICAQPRRLTMIGNPLRDSEIRLTEGALERGVLLIT